MTPSANRPIVSRTAPRNARRTRLLAASALCGSVLGGVAAMLAQPALAQTLPGIPGAGSITVSSDGTQPVITAPGATELDIDLNAAYTVINWSSLHLSSADQMTFHFDAASNIVLNKTTSQIAIDSGATVSGLVGAATAGNIWFYSPQGVIVSSGAHMSAGGFVFSRGSSINDASFVAASDQLANLRAATDALIQIKTITTATSASIDAAGNVLLSASSGNLGAVGNSVPLVEGATATVSTTSGSIFIDEVTATSGAAQVLAGGSGATVAKITGATGVTVSSGNNTSVGTATTTSSGDIVITSNDQASLTVGDSARDILITAPNVFMSTSDHVRNLILTGADSVFLTNRVLATGDIEVTASNGDISANAQIETSGAGSADDAHILIRSDTGSVTANGSVIKTKGTGVAAGDITIQAATTASLGATATSTRDIKVTGVTASLTNGSAARDVFVTATTGGASVTTAATAGDDVEVTATTGAVLASGATLKSTGVGATDDAHVLARSTGSTVNVGSAITQGTGAAVGDITIQAATTATLGSADSTQDVRVAGTIASLTNGSAARDITLTATTGTATVTTAATAGDDVIINANGDVLAGGATLKGTGTGHVGAPGSFGGSYVYVASAAGAVNVGSAITEGTGTAAGDVVITAATTATLGSGDSSRDLTISGASASLTTGQASRDLFVTATTGNATVTTYAIAGDDLEITTTSGNVLASNANLWGGYSGGSDDGHVLVRSTNGSVNVLSAESRGGGVTAGDTTIQAGTTATVGGAFGSRNLTISGAGSFDLSGLYSANNTASFTSTAGAITESGGSIAANTLNLSGATGVALNQINNIINLGVVNGGSGGVTYRDVNNFALTGNVTATGGVTLISNNGAISQSAGAITGNTLNVSAATGITLNQANFVTSLGVLTNGTSGAISFHNDGGFDLTGNVNSAGAVSLFSDNGDITQSGGTLHAGGAFSLDAAGLISVGDIEGNGGIGVTAAGDIDVTSATSGGGVSLQSNGGHAVLRKAVLTGAGTSDDLSIVASGDAILGADDDLSITTDNIFSRTGGGSGTASIRSTSGDALVYLDTTAAFSSLEGANALVLVNSGPVSIGTITANAGDISVEAGDGGLTIDTATATGGGVGLFSNGGDDLTITGAVHGDGPVQIAADGLVDGTAATLISSGGDLTVFGGAVDVGVLEAAGLAGVVAIDVDATVQSIHAGAGAGAIAINGNVSVGTIETDDQGVIIQAAGDAEVQLAKANGANGYIDMEAGGNATLRGGEATDGILVYASDTGTATFGADLGATAVAGVNYGITSAASCGCVPPAADGLQVMSEFGDAVVNVHSLTSPIALVASGEFNNATVILGTGNLKIDELAGYNVTVKAKAGTLETGAAFSGGGDYTITAQDFLGDVLTPTLVTGLIRDVTITDTSGDLALGTLSIHADRKLTIAATVGAVTGSAQLSAGAGAGDGDVNVTAITAIALDSVTSDHDVAVFADAGGIALGTGGAHADHRLTLISTNGAVTALGQISAGSGAGDGDVNVSAGSSITLTGAQADHDVNLSADSGGIDFGATTAHADHWLNATALHGTVSSTGLLDAGAGLGDGRVWVEGAGISLGTVSGDNLIRLNAGTGLVDVATSVNAAANYTLIGGDFANAALTPHGARAGTWTIQDKAGGFDFSGKTLHYGGVVLLYVDGVVNGGDITSDTGGVFAEVESGHLGVLSAPTVVGVDSTVGGLSIDAINAGTLAQVRAVNSGAASLGAATLSGAGTNRVIVKALNGDAVLGAATPGAIAAANLVSSAGATTTVDVTAVGGRVDVNLDHITGAHLTTLDAARAVNVKVASGALTIDQLTAGRTSQVIGGGDTTLVSADVTGDLGVTSTAGGLRFGDATPGRVIDVSGALTLSAATDIAQQGSLHAFDLGVTSGTGVVLLGANQVRYLDAVTVSAGGFAFHDTLAFDLYGAVNAVGQTVDLRSDGAIGQVSTGTITARTLKGSSVGGADFGAFNQVAELGDFTNTGGLLRLVEGRSLTVTGTVLSTGTAALTSHGGMTFASTGTIRADGTGDAVTLVSDGVFTNARGADAVTAGNAAGRWLIYTQAAGNPTGSTAGNSFNGLSGKSFYGTAYDFFNETFSGAINPGNRFVYAYQPILTVTPNSRTVTYDGTIPTTSSAITGLVNGDLPADAITWSGAPLVVGATSKNAGTYALSIDLGGLSSDFNYAFVGATGTLRIDPKALTGALTANDKTYDGTTVATGSVGLIGVVAGDTVSASGTYAFADKTAATGKTVTASGVILSGADAANYSLASTATDTADIARKTLTGALTANDKTYDGTTAATGSVGLTGVVSGDTVNAAGTYAFADKTVATGKTVTASGVTLSGADAGNYTLTSTATDTADIARKTLTGALTANDKTYDGTTAATGSVGLTGVVAGDTVSASGTYAFADKNAATGKTVTASGVTLAGADAANYSLASTATDTADILKKGVSGALTASGKTYDGTTAATGSIALTGVLAGETVTASGTYNFADKNAATGKTVSASGVTLAGADAANYSVTSVSTALADILRRPVTVAADGGSKAFGQADPVLTYHLSVGALAAGDAFTGVLGRGAGEIPGTYGITRGTLALSANYDLTFTGAVFTIQQIPVNERGDGSSSLKYLNQSPDFTLDWDPESQLTTTGSSEGGVQVTSGAGRVVAALR